jgi:hypothetical protein
MNKSNPLVKIAAVAIPVVLAAAFIRDRAGGFDQTRAFIRNDSPATTPERVDLRSVPRADTALFYSAQTTAILRDTGIGEQPKQLDQKSIDRLKESLTIMSSSKSTTVAFPLVAPK